MKKMFADMYLFSFISFISNAIKLWSIHTKYIVQCHWHCMHTTV